MRELYTLPPLSLSFDAVYGVGGVLLFVVGIVGATALACRSELSQMPATLMRPKAPRAGSRVFLERIPAIWSRLGFLKKVTVRNLFRYKKCLFMTVGGILGCTALILCGFAIKDSVASLAPKQCETIYTYDLMAVLEDDSVLSSVSSVQLKEEFGFDLILTIVFLIVSMAGGLAFVVLFTLSNTNISERVRELATTKVLGFYDGEVHRYVNRETLILSVIGIALGLPAGRLISGFLTVVLNMPSIHFAVEVFPVSYVITAAVTLSFARIVNAITNRTLNRIDMVEALKSVE